VLIICRWNISSGRQETPCARAARPGPCLLDPRHPRGCSSRRRPSSRPDGA